jgi:hypothetical protein
MSNELNQILKEINSYMNYMNYYNNNMKIYIINKDWIQKWYILINNAQKNHKINESYKSGIINNLEICEKNCFSDDPNRKYIVSSSKYVTISKETWDLFKIYYNYDKEIKKIELYEFIQIII